MSVRDSFPPEQPGEGSSAPARRKKRHQTLRACDLCRRKKSTCMFQLLDSENRLAYSEPLRLQSDVRLFIYAPDRREIVCLTYGRVAGDGLDGKKIPCTNCADYDLTCTYGTHQYKVCDAT